jgi:hypothetical protein
MLLCIQIFCFRTKLRVREVRSPFSDHSNTVLGSKSFIKHLTVFGKQWEYIRDQSLSISVQDLDKTHDISTYNPGLRIQRSINKSDSEDNDD